MIIDSNLVFFDCEELNGTIESKEVALTSLFAPGRSNRAIPLAIKLLGDITGVTKVTFTFKHADEEGGAYEDIQEVVVDGTDLVSGRVLGFRFLSAKATKQWLKIEAEVDGTCTGDGALFGCVAREDEMEYTKGMYIDKGEVLF